MIEFSGGSELGTDTGSIMETSAADEMLPDIGESAEVSVNAENTGSEISPGAGGQDGAESLGIQENPQSQVEAIHRSALENILEEDGRYISPADRDRIGSGPSEISVVASIAPDVTGGYHFGSDSSSIKVVSFSEMQQERSTIHETHHFASCNREICIPEPGKNGYRVVNTVGTRQASWFHSCQTGENYNYTEHGRGLNEGITTLFTNQSLYRISAEKGKAAEQQQIYGNAVDLVGSLAEIVGEEPVKQAYYGGNCSPLEKAVDRLAGEKQYLCLRDCLDRSISDSWADRAEATRQARDILAAMSERKGSQ